MKLPLLASALCASLLLVSGHRTNLPDAADAFPAVAGSIHAVGEDVIAQCMTYCSADKLSCEKKIDIDCPQGPNYFQCWKAAETLCAQKCDVCDATCHTNNPSLMPAVGGRSSSTSSRLKKLTRQRQLVGSDLCTSTCEQQYRICASNYCPVGDQSCEARCWSSYQSCQIECIYAPVRGGAPTVEALPSVVTVASGQPHEECMYACLGDWAQCVGACKPGDSTCYAACKAMDVNVCIPRCPPETPPTTVTVTPSGQCRAAFTSCNAACFVRPEPNCAAECTAEMDACLRH